MLRPSYIGTPADHFQPLHPSQLKRKHYRGAAITNSVHSRILTRSLTALSWVLISHREEMHVKSLFHGFHLCTAKTQIRNVL